MNDKAKIIPLILAGGQGSRLWPTSTRDLPKQFIPLKSGGTTFCNALARVQNKNIFADPVVICAEHNLKIVENLLKERAAQIICEPVGRNTAPACCIGSLSIEQTAATPQLMLILPADHFIGDIEQFEKAVERATPFAEAGNIVTFGIRPEFGHTEYGYIERGRALAEDIYTVESFNEKPRIRAAQSYFKSGHYFWNAGIFLVRTDILLEEMKVYQSDIFLYAQHAWEHSRSEGRCRFLERDSFEKLPKISFDYAVMEHTTRAAVIDFRFKWQDLGGWDALMEFSIGENLSS